MSKKHKKVYTTLNNIEHFVVGSTITGWISISAFASLVGIRIGITNYEFCNRILIKTKKEAKSCKKILIYYITYMTIKNSKYMKINSVHPLYLLLNKMNEYFEGINGTKHLAPAPTNENKEKTKIMKNCGLNSEI